MYSRYLVAAAADVADEGADAAVEKYVLLEVALVHEALGADGALEVVLGRVALLVDAGRGHRGEALPADGAEHLLAAFAVHVAHVLLCR